MTPSLSTSTPALASPATTAASRNSPEARGSRPTTATGRAPGPAWLAVAWPPSTAAAATLRFKARVAVSSSPATPRTASVPNNRLRCPVSAISLPTHLPGPLLCWVRGELVRVLIRLGSCAQARQAPRGRHLPLGVLRRLAGLLQAVLLALLDPGVPGQEAGLLQRRAVLRVHQGQRPGHAEAQRARLPDAAAAGDPGHDVELVLRAQGHERLVDELLVHLVREVDVERPAVDRPLARAGGDTDPGDSLLAAAGASRVTGDHRAPRDGPRRGVLGALGGVLRRGVRAELILGVLAGVDVVLDGGGAASGLSHGLDLVLPLLSPTALLRYCAIWVISYGLGCCAPCGWSGPAYTLSLRSVLRPRVFFGSIPRTAFSTARSGWLAIRLA